MSSILLGLDWISGTNPSQQGNRVRGIEVFLADVTQWLGVFKPELQHNWLIDLTREWGLSRDWLAPARAVPRISASDCNAIFSTHTYCD